MDISPHELLRKGMNTAVEVGDLGREDPKCVGFCAESFFELAQGYPDSVGIGEEDEFGTDVTEWFVKPKLFLEFAKGSQVVCLRTKVPKGCWQSRQSSVHVLDAITIFAEKFGVGSKAFSLAVKLLTGSLNHDDFRVRDKACEHLPSVISLINSSQHFEVLDDICIRAPRCLSEPLRCYLSQYELEENSSQDQNIPAQGVAHQTRDLEATRTYLLAIGEFAASSEKVFQQILVRLCLIARRDRSPRRELFIQKLLRSVSQKVGFQSNTECLTSYADYLWGEFLHVACAEVDFAWSTSL